MSESERLKLRLAELEQQLKSRREQLETQLNAKANNQNRSPTPYSRPTSAGGFAYNSRGHRGRTRGARPALTMRRTDLHKPSKVVLGSNESQEEGTEFIRENSKGSMTLVNSQVYEEEKKRKQEIANKILEEKHRRQKVQLKNALLAHIKHNRSKYDSVNRLEIEGVYYALVKNKSTLAILTVPDNYPDDVKTILVHDNKIFKKISTGDYVTQDIAPANELQKENCKYYSKTGYCRYNDRCNYIHNPQCLALCHTVLAKIKCTNNSCLLSHQPSQYNAPACKYFSNGDCTNINCLFSHRVENPNSPICRQFTIGGVCPEGRECPLRHDLLCPDKEEYGECPRGAQCKLQHRGSHKGEAVKEPADPVRNEDNDIVDVSHSHRARNPSEDKINFEMLQQGLDDDDESGDEKIEYTKDEDMNDDNDDDDDDDEPIHLTQESNTSEDLLHKNADYVNV